MDWEIIAALVLLLVSAGLVFVWHRNRKEAAELAKMYREHCEAQRRRLSHVRGFAANLAEGLSAPDGGVTAIGLDNERSQVGLVVDGRPRVFPLERVLYLDLPEENPGHLVIAIEDAAGSPFVVDFNEDVLKFPGQTASLGIKLRERAPERAERWGKYLKEAIEES